MVWMTNRHNLRGSIEDVNTFDGENQPRFQPHELQSTLTSDELQTLIHASYADLDDAEKLAKKYGYYLDKELSNEENKVFKDRRDDDVIIGFRGTKNNQDIATDIALAVGLENYTDRFDKSRSFVDKVRFKYKNNPILAIGDSLGGSIAESVGDKVDRVITSNKGVGLRGIGKKIRKNQTDIRNDTDYISLLSKTQHGGREKIEIKDKTTWFQPLQSHEHKHIRELHRSRI